MRAEDRRVIAVAWVVVAAATAGSQYYQHGLGLYPCELCWDQRILMYPLVVVLGYATLARQPDAHRTVLPLAVPGLVVAAYHSALQLAPTAQCSVGGCATVQVRVLGLSIPNQSALAFALVAAAMLWRWRRFRGEPAGEADD